MAKEAKKRRGSLNQPKLTGKKLQSKILNVVKTDPRLKGRVVAYKIEVGNQRGIPDILCCAAGRFVGIELKGEDDKASKIQIANIERIRKAKGLAAVVESIDEFFALMQEAFRL